jgi:hypothetical protein
MDILIGIIVLALILGVGYVVTHHKPPATVAGADLANTVSAAASDAWEAVKRDLPSIVSADLAQAKADLASALQDAQALRDRLAATIAAHAADKAAVAARVAAAVTASPELPPSTLAPAVEAQDAARVVAFADQINPAQSAQA